MQYIDSLEDFYKLIHTHEEIILFRAGNEGWLTLELLKYTDSLKRICCIAQDRVDDFKNVAQKFENFLPIIPLEHLVHFRESGIMSVAAPVQLHERINQILVAFGFKKCVFLSPKTFEQEKKLLAQISSSGGALNWFMNHVTQKISDLELLLTEQNEICAVNTKAFAEYRNRFRGKKIVIFATGPTSKYYSPPPHNDLHETIHIGVNFAWRREDIPLDYLFIQDSNLQNPQNTLSDIKIEDGLGRIRSKIFVGRYSKISWSNGIELSEDFSADKNIFRRYFVNVSGVNQILHKNICCHGLADFASVTFPALHFALFTYPKQIYLVGCDTIRTGHFYDDPKKLSADKSMTNVPEMKVGYARMKMFARQYYSDTEIISVNPVGLKGLFKDVYTENYQP